MKIQNPNLRFSTLCHYMANINWRKSMEEMKFVKSHNKGKFRLNTLLRAYDYSRQRLFGHLVFLTLNYFKSYATKENTVKFFKKKILSRFPCLKVCLASQILTKIGQNRNSESECKLRVLLKVKKLITDKRLDADWNISLKCNSVFLFSHPILLSNLFMCYLFPGFKLKAQ